MGGNRGGVTPGRGRGSFNASPARGGPPGPASGPLRPHNSRNTFGPGNKDHSRRGGSFGGNYGSGSFRGGRNQGHSNTNRNRNEGGSTFGSREGIANTSFNKKDENRRTLTDFKIVGLEIPELHWTWGVVSEPTKVEKDGTDVDGVSSATDSLTKDEDSEASQVLQTKEEERAPESMLDTVSCSSLPVEAQGLDGSASQSPPSRIRIYFHTPVTADDSRPIPHNVAYGESPSDSRKGKRKKLEDDDGDGDLEDRRVRPPPQMGLNDDRDSAGASVGETPSEGDWLMAAIVEGEDNEAEAAGAVSHPEDDEATVIDRVGGVHDVADEREGLLGGELFL